MGAKLEQFRSVTADTTGHFTIPNVTPGEQTAPLAIHSHLLGPHVSATSGSNW